MAHEIETRNGKASHFYVGETPWHGLGTKLDAPPTVAAAIIHAGLDWEVGLKALVTTDGEAVDHRATYRKVDGKILGVVGPHYTPLQNVDAFQWFQPLVDSGEVELHTAGSLQEGKKVWVLAKIRQAAIEIAPNDRVERFILLSNSHDGSRAVRLGFTPIRVVCANTLRFAHNSAESNLIRVLHHSTVKMNLDALRQIVCTANAAFEATAEQYRRLASRKINGRDLRKYVRKVLGIEKDADLHSLTENRIKAIVELATQGKGNGMPGVKGTLWAAYNAVTEYLGWTYGKSQDRRIDSLWFGDNARENQKALDLALSMAA